LLVADCLAVIEAAAHSEQGGREKFHGVVTILLSVRQAGVRSQALQGELQVLGRCLLFRVTPWEGTRECVTSRVADQAVRRESAKKHAQVVLVPVAPTTKAPRSHKVA
jgi:hypothetical protein